MNTREEIQTELNSLAPALQSIITNTNVFTVPEGYFDEVPVQVLGKIFKPNSTSQDVPAGYFDNFANSVLSKIKSQEFSESMNAEQSAKEELQELSPILFGIGNRNVFTVPDQYFEQTAAHISKTVSTFTEDAQQELRFLSPALYAIGNSNIMQVPRNYFNDLPTLVLSRIRGEKEAARIVPMRSYKMLKYMMAAAIVGILGFGAFQFFNKEQINTSTSTNTVVMAQAKELLQKGDLDAVFNSLSETEVTTYLKTNGEDIQSALVATSVNSPELPEPVDYMLDDNTLDKFLETNNLRN